MEDDLQIFKVEYLSNHLLDHSQILNLSLDDQIIFLPTFKMKTTFNGGQRRRVKSEISQHQLIESFSNFKLKLR